VKFIHAFNSKMSTYVVGQNVLILVITWLSYGRRQSGPFFTETQCSMLTIQCDAIGYTRA